MHQVQRSFGPVHHPSLAAGSLFLRRGLRYCKQRKTEKGKGRSKEKREKVGCQKIHITFKKGRSSMMGLLFRSGARRIILLLVLLWS